MFRLPVSFSRFSGLGPLPRLFEAAEGGRALHRLLASENLQVEAMAPSTPIPFSNLNEVFNRASRQSSDALFTVRVAQAMRPEDYGPMVDFALAGSSLAVGIRRLSRFAQLQSNAMVFGFREIGAEASWSLHYLAARGLQVENHALHVMVPLIQFVRRYAGASARPIAMHLASARNSAHRILEDALEISIRAGDDVFRIVFPSDWLTLRRQPAKAPAIISFSEMIAYYRQEALPTSLTDTVAAMVRPNVGNAEIDLDVIAARLNVSRRTLQLRLNAEGSSFRDIALDIRMSRAKELIRAGRESISQVALAVGYSDQAHFHRAFKVQTGLTPQEFRRLNTPGALFNAEAAE